jgi:flagellar biosynthesis/type III secretory pathway protein FliH
MGPPMTERQPSAEPSPAAPRETPDPGRGAPGTTQERPPAIRVPTLTEVVAAAASAEAAAEAPDEGRLVAEVLHELHQRIDLMFEYRVREALSPLLARVAETLIREAREELAATLRDVVQRAVAQELARRRTR